MFDSTQNNLLDAAKKAGGRCLWLADDAASEILAEVKSANLDVTILTNRFDIHTLANKLGLPSHFNDWEFEQEAKYDTIALRVCKEKAVNFHLIIQAAKHLSSNGTFILAGEKNDGIKSLSKSASNYFFQAGQAKKNGGSYITHCSQPNYLVESTIDYRAFSSIGEVNGIKLYSKPGVYGWNKIDQGSELLIQQFREQVRSWHSDTFDSVLDIGCGYGYLSFAVADLPFKTRVATDNNAAALAACRHSALQAGLDLDVVASDCAAQITQSFSCILCNPPFHRGFDIQSDLTTRFLAAAKARLSKEGRAFFVVNSFIGIEEKAKKFFSNVITLTNNKQFKVLQMN